MALELSVFVEQGVYIGEIIPANAVNITTTPQLTGIIAPGDRQKRVSNESVQRGLVEQEVLTLINLTGTGDTLSAPVSGVVTLTDAATLFGTLRTGSELRITGATNPTNNGVFIVLDVPSTSTLRFSNPAGVLETSAFTWAVTPFAALANRADRKLQNTTLSRNGIAQSDNFIAFQAAYLLGTAAGPFDVRISNGTGDSFAFAAGIVTLTDAAGAFTQDLIGSLITIVGATTGGNNGTFRVATVPSGTTLTYANTAGATEAFAGTWHISDASFALETDGIRAVTLRLQHTASSTSGTGDSFVFGAGIVTLTDAGATFQQSLVGTQITIVGATSSGNNGTFVVATVPSATTLTYANAAGVTEAYTGTYTLTCQVVGREVRIQATFSGALPGQAATRAEVAAAINRGLPGATAVGYSSLYGSLARDATTGIQLTSPITTSGSDVRIFAPLTHSYLITFFGAAGADNRDAQSVLRVSTLIYSATGVFTADYINIVSNADTLSQTPVIDLLRVGSAANIGDYATNIDYILAGNTVSWGGTGAPPDTAPEFIGSKAQTYNVAVNFNLDLAFDVGGPEVTVRLTGLTPAPLGYANPVSAAAATAAEIAANINAVIGNHASYGPRFNAVASAVVTGVGTVVRLTSPTEGSSGSVTVSASASLDARFEVFNIQSTQPDVIALGVGKRPALAALYFVTYTITRATSEYNMQKRFFSLEAARADLGPTTSANPLMIAAELAFRQRANAIVVVQVNDLASAGSPTRQEFLNAMNATLKTDLITDLIVLSTALDVQTDLRDHIEFANSPTVKRYRRGWFGMPRNTNVGDKDTPDTYVFRSRRTLQVAADSPGRGRLILTAPPQISGVSRDITLEDASTARINLDSTYVAVSLASKRSSFSGPAQSLSKKTVTGFNTDDITEAGLWAQAERNLLSGQGVMVVNFNGGLFQVSNPHTTEVGGGGLEAFAYESTSPQKDNITRKLEQAIDAGVVGIVPTDLADFIVDIKMIIRSVIAGEITAKAIAPYTNPDGTTRGISLTTDIDVKQSANKKTRFFFSTTYNLRYPALEVLGEFAVDAGAFLPI